MRAADRRQQAPSSFAALVGLAGLSGLLFLLPLAGFALFELLGEILVFLEADILALIGLDPDAPVPFALIAAALALLSLLTLAAIRAMLLLLLLLLIGALLFLLLARIRLLAGIPVLVVHGDLL